MRIWILLAFGFLAVTCRGAALRFGSETAVSLPSNSLYSTAQNVRPGNNETVTNNPPIFSYYYATNWLTDANPNGFFPHWNTQTNEFNFQITAASDTTFASPVVSVSTPFNDYNFIDPLDTNTTRSFIWRTIIKTNGIAYWTNGPYTFHIASTASPWPRAVFGTTNYFFTNGLHAAYRAGNESNVWYYTTNNDARMLSDLLAAGEAGTNATWWHTVSNWPANPSTWPNAQSSESIDYSARANSISAVMFLNKFSGDNRWTNASMTGWLDTNLSKFVLFWNSNNYAMQDYGDSQSMIPPRLVPIAYVWNKHRWTNNPTMFTGNILSNLLVAAVRICRFQTYGGNGIWAANPFPTGGYIYLPTNDLNNIAWDYQNRAYTNTTTTNTLKSSTASSRERQGNSHGSLSEQATDPVVIMASEHPEILFYAQRKINYSWSRGNPFGGWAANHLGAYGYVGVNFSSLMTAMQWLRVAWPQAQFERAEWMARFPEWYSRMIPYGMRKHHGPWGDGAPNGDASYFMGKHSMGLDLALATGSGLARQLWDLNRQYSNTYWVNYSHFDELALRSNFTLPAAATNSNVGVYIEDGYFAVGSKSPSEFGAYSNGIGFAIAAAPRGPYGNHYGPTGAPDIWAYGTQLTDWGGAGLDEYGYRTQSGQIIHITNGMGSFPNAAPYSLSQHEPWHQRISHVGTNNPICYFVGVDLLPGYTNYNELFRQSLPDPRSNSVSKVMFYMAQVRSNYWVFCADVGFTRPDTAMFRWLIPWVFRYQAGGSPLTGEIAVSGDRFVSNSLSIVSGGADYTAGNIADANYPNPPRMPAFLRFAKNTADYGVFVAKGTTSLTVGNTSVIGTANTNSTLNPFQNRTYGTAAIDREAGLWFTNTVPATNVVWTGAIMFKETGESEPVFTRHTDRSYSVTYKGITDVFSWGETNAEPASTIIFAIDGSADSAPPDLPPAGDATSRGVKVGGGVTIRGSFK